ncbi:MAG: hypothetical protein L0216_16925 [Planctomycetales bacterium]|nr:hypothetical protein [Planctomycetales bacterium]
MKRLLLVGLLGLAACSASGCHRWLRHERHAAYHRPAVVHVHHPVPPHVVVHSPGCD